MAGNQVRIGVGVKDDATKPINGIRNAFKTLQNDGAKGFAIGAGAAVTAKGLTLVDSAISGVAATITQTIQKAASFERGMLNINSIAKVSSAELAAMGQAVLKMSGEFGQSADTMTAALYDINSSGFAGAKGIEVLRASAKAATAGLATTAEAASGIAAVLNSYGMQAKDATHVSDVLFKTVERGVVSFPELSAQIGKTTALASPLGVSLEEVGAALAVMTRHGIDAENATTQLNAIMSSMLQPAAEATTLAKQLGLDWSSAGLKANGLTGQLNAMIKATGGSEAKMAVLLGDVRAIRGAFSLASNSGGELNDELAIMQGASGATESAFGIQAQGAAFKMAQASAKLDAALISLGQTALPALADGADAASTAIEGMAPIARDVTQALDDMGKQLDFLSGRQLRGTGEATDILGSKTTALGVVLHDIFDSGWRERMERAAGAVEGMRTSTVADLGAVGTVATTTAGMVGELPKALEVASAKAVRVAQKTPGQIAAALRQGRDEWQQALDDLKSDAETKMSRAAEIAKLKGILAGKELADGLKSKDPVVRAAAAALERTATERLGVLRGTASKVGDRAARDLAAAIKRGRPHTAAAAQLHEIAVKNALGTLPSSAYGWGVALGRNYASGIKSTVTVVKLSAQALAQAAARNLRLRSPAEEGPLSGVGPEGWGKKLASDFAKGMAGGKRGIGAAGAALAGAASFTGQGGVAGGGMALAGAGAGINITINFPGMIVAPTQAQAAEIGRLVGPAVADHLRSRGFIPR